LTKDFFYPGKFGAVNALNLRVKWRRSHRAPNRELFLGLTQLRRFKRYNQFKDL